MVIVIISISVQLDVVVSVCVDGRYDLVDGGVVVGTGAIAVVEHEEIARAGQSRIDPVRTVRREEVLVGGIAAIVAIELLGEEAEGTPGGGPRTDTLADVVLVPTGALGGSSTAPSVDVFVDGVAETRSVTTGLITATQVEIVSGVSAGEQVVIGEVTP